MTAGRGEGTRDGARALPEDVRGHPPPILTVGLSVALVAAFGLLATLDAASGPARVEALVSTWLQERRSPALDRLMIGATLLGDHRLTTTLMIALVALLALARRPWLAVHAASVFLSIKLAVALLKVTLARARPLDLPATADLYAFPSGHAASAGVVLGVVGALWLARRSDRARDATLALPFALLAALVALSRVYLGAHWPSDVAGALALALALVAAFDWQLRRAAPLPSFVPHAALALLIGGYLLYVAALFAVEAPRYAPTAQEAASSPQSSSSLRSRPQVVR